MYILTLLIVGLLGERAPVPDEASQKESAATVAAVFKSDYDKAKTPQQKLELAHKLLAEATSTHDDKNARFVLFRIGRDIAAQQGDISTAFQAIRKLEADYQIDSIQMYVDASTSAIKAMKVSRADHAVWVATLLPVVDEALEKNQFSHAKTLIGYTLTFAREARDPERLKIVFAKSKEVDEILSEFDKIKPFKDTLDVNPIDPASNLAIGRFLCFNKGDWKRGLTKLALGGVTEPSSAAQLELEDDTDPVKIGDQWWKVAESLKGTAKIRCQLHAAEWYRKALPTLNGLNKTRIERLVADAYEGK